LTDLQAMADRIRGTYKMPEDPTKLAPRIINGLKTLNFLNRLGGMTIAAFTDPPRAIMVHGLTSTLRDGFLPLISNFKNFRLAADEVQTAGTALEMILGTRALAIGDVLDEYGRYSKFERALGAARDSFGMVTLMSPWNSMMKQFVGVVGQTNMLRGAEQIAAGTAKRPLIEKLAGAGIDPQTALIIADQFKKHGAVNGGVYFPNSAAWDVADPNVRRALDALRGAVVRDADRTIVTPGQDKPLWMSSQLGSLVSQFKSFQMASVQRTLLAGLQQRDAGLG